MNVLTIEIDCTSHPFDGTSGYPSLVEIAERYGVMIEERPRNLGWAWWYRLTGPRENLVRFMDAEYDSGDNIEEYLL
jgi:hypothetical protein